jgi:hypothetical protein
MYIVGQEETVGESSVSSGCWGEDSDHKYGWARRTPTFVAPIRFFKRTFHFQNPTDLINRQDHYRLRAVSNYHSLS